MGSGERGGRGAAVAQRICAAIVVSAILVSAALGAAGPGPVGGISKQLPALAGNSSPGQFKRAIDNADTLMDGEWLRLTQHGAEAGITGAKMASLAALAAVPGPEKIRAILELVHYCTTPGEAFELLKLAPSISEELANLHRDEQYREQALLEFKFVHRKDFLKWFRSNEQPRWTHLQQLRRMRLQSETKEVLNVAKSGTCAARAPVVPCPTNKGIGAAKFEIRITYGSGDGVGDVIVSPPGQKLQTRPGYTKTFRFCFGAPVTIKLKEVARGSARPGGWTIESGVFAGRSPDRCQETGSNISRDVATCTLVFTSQDLAWARSHGQGFGAVDAEPAFH